MPTISFTVPGDPEGYYACGKFPNWTRLKKYHAYRDKVRTFAAAAGVSIPLVATKESPLSIHVTPFFRSGVHCDPGNVQKGLVDGLFWSKTKQKGSGDKWTGGSFPSPKYDPDNPRVEVQIQIGAGCETGSITASDNTQIPALKPAAASRASELCSGATPLRKSRPVKKSIWGDRA